MNKFSFLDTKEMRKTSPSEVMEAILYMSKYLGNKALNSPDDDLDTKAQETLALDMYEKPENMGDIITFNDILIGVPSIKPVKNYSTGVRKNGMTVIPLVHLPGKPPYYAWDQKCPTLLTKYDLSLRVARSLAIHSVVPGMKISFHFFDFRDGMKTRTKIIGKYIDYDEDNRITAVDLDESEVAVPMPDIEEI